MLVRSFRLLRRQHGTTHANLEMDSLAPMPERFFHFSSGTQLEIVTSEGRGALAMTIATLTLLRSTRKHPGWRELRAHAQERVAFLLTTIPPLP